MGFSVNSIPRKKGTIERKGGRVRDQLDVEQMLQKRSTKAAISSCNAEGNLFWGLSCEKPWNQKDCDRVDHWSQCVGQQVHESVQLSPPSITP